MSDPEGGKAFLQHFVKAAVQESVKQEGHERYRQRVEKLKHMPDYIITLVCFPLVALLQICRIILYTLKYTATGLAILLALFIMMVMVNAIEIVVYEHRQNIRRDKKNGGIHTRA